MGIEILALGFAFTVPVGIVVAIVAWASHVAKRRAATWAALAQRMGLQYSNHVVYGPLEGQPVRLHTETRGSGKNKSTWTVVSGFVSPAFDLGLSVTRHGFFATLGELVGSTDIEVGDPAFDKAFVVRADEPGRAQIVLGSALRSTLHSVLQSRYTFRLGDGGFSIERQGASEDVQWLEWCLRISGRIVRLMSEVRASLPVAAPLAGHRAAWVSYAQAAGLQGLDCPLTMWGRMEGAQISAYAVRVAAFQYRLEVLVKFDSPLGVGLLVRPTGTLDAIGAFFGGQDEKLGDAAFDPAFTVKIAQRDRAARILDAEVRRRIMELSAQVGAVQVRDDGVVVRTAALNPDPTEVPRVVAQARQLSTRIAQNAAAIDVQAAGPYR